MHSCIHTLTHSHLPPPHPTHTLVAPSTDEIFFRKLYCTNTDSARVNIEWDPPQSSKNYLQPTTYNLQPVTSYSVTTNPDPLSDITITGTSAQIEVNYNRQYTV